MPSLASPAYGFLSLSAPNGNGLGVAPNQSATLGTAGAGWTAVIALRRNTTSGTHPIISNLSSTVGNGGFEIRVDGLYSQIMAIFDNGTGTRPQVTSLAQLTQTNLTYYIAVTVDPASTPGGPKIRFYWINSSGVALLDATSSTYAVPVYIDPPALTNVVIGANPLNTSGVSDLQLAFIAIWDAVVITPTNLSLLQAVYNAAVGTGQFAGR